MRYSYSSLSMYQKCGLMFKFQYIDKLPTTFIQNQAIMEGRMVHRILELSSNRTYEDVLMTLVEEFRNYDTSKKLLDSITKEYISPLFYKDLLLTEHKLTFTYKDVEFVAIIDRINKVDNEYELIDYKYGNYEYTNFDSLQPQLYAWAMFETFGNDIKIKFSYYNLKVKSKISRRYTIDQIDKEAIYTLVQRSMKIYTPNPGLGCLFCSFLSQCNEGKEYMSSDIELEEPDIKHVGLKYLQLQDKQKLYNIKKKKYTNILSQYFEYSGETELNIEDNIIRFDNGKVFT